MGSSFPVMLGLAGKYRTAVVTEEGDVFMWEGWSKPLDRSAAAPLRPAPAPPGASVGDGGRIAPDAPLPPPAAEAAAAAQPHKKSKAQRLFERITPSRRELQTPQRTSA
jgi:hypothetical protein